MRTLLALLLGLAMTALAQENPLAGVIDIHVHCAPDSTPRSIDAIDLARLASQRGMRGLVLKNHYQPTASLAYIVRKEVPGIEIFGGISLDLTNGGVNHSFEVLGRKETAEQAFAMLAPGGTATIVGMIPFGQKIELHGFDFLRERRIQGSSMGSNHFRVDMPRLVEFYMRGKLHLEDWISAKLKLPEINEGFAAMKAGKTVRSVIMFDA